MESLLCVKYWISCFKEPNLKNRRLQLMRIQHRRAMKWKSTYTGKSFSLLLKYSSVSSPWIYFTILFRIKSNVLWWLTYCYIIWLFFTSWIFLSISYLVYSDLATPIFNWSSCCSSNIPGLPPPERPWRPSPKDPHLPPLSSLQAFSEMLASQDAYPNRLSKKYTNSYTLSGTLLCL